MLKIELPIEDVVLQYKQQIADLAEQLAMERAKSAFLQRVILKLEDGQTLTTGGSIYESLEEEPDHDHDQYITTNTN